MVVALLGPADLDEARRKSTGEGGAQGREGGREGGREEQTLCVYTLH